MLSTFRNDGSLNVIVESPRGSSVKFKHDPDEDVMMVSRPLPFGLAYPYDWGYIPSTRAADGDPLDAVIVWDGVSYPAIVVACRTIGVLKVEQTNRESKRRERNDRVIVLPMAAARQAHIESVFDLDERIRNELEQFFLHAVAFEGKELRLLGWDGPQEADTLIRQSAKAESAD